MKQRIVLLDDICLGKDFAWPDFGLLGDFETHPGTTPDQVAERVKDAAVVLTNKVVITAEHIAASPLLKYVGCVATGYNHVDIGAAKERGVTVTNVPDYSTPAVMQHVFALILEFTNNTALHSGSVMNGDWAKSPGFCYWKSPIMELSGKTMGIIGFGHIGRKVGQVAEAFGMRVLAYSPRKKEAPEYGNFAFAGLEEIFRESDVISLHCPLTPENTGMVNKKLLSLMKKSAILINTARGPLVNEKDLAEALHNGDIGGAGLDVVAVEPMRTDNPLFKAPNCLITPHLAWASVESRSRLMQEVFNNIRAWQNGAPVNVVNA